MNDLKSRVSVMSMGDEAVRIRIELHVFSNEDMDKLSCEYNSIKDSSGNSDRVDRAILLAFS